MAYVIMNVGTELTHKDKCNVTKEYATTRGAGIACTKLNKSFGNCGQWQVMSIAAYELGFPVKMKTVKNLMSGLPVEIAENTPLCCDPSSETYWSM